jgi:hypothetical protein
LIVFWASSRAGIFYLFGDSFDGGFVQVDQDFTLEVIEQDSGLGFLVFGAPGVWAKQVGLSW